MIPSINWLHISDIHLKIGQEWPRDRVLNALLSAIGEYTSGGNLLSFVLISGDLAYSGSKNEYDHIAPFIDKLIESSKVPKEMVFCVPGNHDVQRSRQKLAFRGARELLQSQNNIDEILSDREEIDALLLRLENYINFQSQYFSTQSRDYIDSKLSYVSNFSVHDIRFSILGLNSAWLSEGDIADHGRLLIGERQIVDTLQISSQYDPHFCLAVCHHPLHLLVEFDRRIAQARIENGCMFYHCGHLHFPEIKTGNCVILSAGASYETRFTHNSFSVVSLNIEKSSCEINIAHYNPHSNLFKFDSQVNLPVSASSSILPSTEDLAQAISKYDNTATLFAFYLSNLILGNKSEFPLFINDRWCFANPSVLRDMAPSEMKTKTIDFNHFQNLLKVFINSKSPLEILEAHGERVKAYVEFLNRCCAANQELRLQIQSHEEDSKNLSKVEPKGAFSHTYALYGELKADSQWDDLKKLSGRHLDSDDLELAKRSLRMYALSLANSPYEGDMRESALILSEFYEKREIAGDELSLLISLLTRFEEFDRAKHLVMNGITLFPDKSAEFIELGHRIVEETGDKTFRDLLRVTNK